MTNPPTKAPADTTHPLKPNYTGPTKGWFAWVHHGTILEWSDNIIERTDYVHKNKPEHEMGARIEHMVHVPDRLIPKYFKEARAKWREADAKLYEAAAKLYEAAAKREEAAAKAYYSPLITTYLKKHTPYAWDGKNSSLIYS